MDLKLQGRRALVLGGSKGLGRGVAMALAAEGAAVAIVGRDEAALAATAEALRRLAPGALAFRADLADPGAVAGLLGDIDRELGGVDILLLNGGGPPPFPAAAGEIEPWRTQFDAMVLPYVTIAAHLLPRMRAARWGRIIAVASTSVREPIAGLTASNALRAAVAGWAKTLAGEVAADGVTVNLLLPGYFATERTARLDRLEAEARGVSPEVVAAESEAGVPVRRYGTAAEFGAVAAFLASDQAAYITGTAIPVDGGLLRSML